MQATLLHLKLYSESMQKLGFTWICGARLLFLSLATADFGAFVCLWLQVVVLQLAHILDQVTFQLQPHDWLDRKVEAT